MKNTTTSVLGFEVPITNFPENMAECVTAAGGEQQVVEGWLSYIRFHKTNGVARSEVSDRLEALTGIKRKTKNVKAPTEANPENTREEWDETEGVYAKRVIAESGKDVPTLQKSMLDGFTYNDSEGKEQTFEPLSVEFNAQAAERTGGPKKLAAVYTKAATQIIAAGSEQWTKTIGILKSLNAGMEITMLEDGTPDVESLATAIKTNAYRVEKEANAALGIG